MNPNKLRWWIEYNNIILKSLIGFREGLSTVDNLTAFSLEIELAFDKNVLCVVLNFEGAFNYVLLDILIEMLADIVCSEKLVRLINF